MLPKNTSLGELEIEEIYEFYDFPRLFSCKNRLGHFYLVISIEDLDDGWKWLYVPVSESRLQKIRLGEITLRDSFKNAEENLIYSVLLYTDASIPPEVKTVSCEKIPEQWLPEKGERLKLRLSSTAKSFQNFYNLDSNDLQLQWNPISEVRIKYSGNFSTSPLIYANPWEGVPYLISNEIPIKNLMQAIKTEPFYEEDNDQTPVAA